MIKKNAMTLLEIMVVVFFIGIIASLLAVNIKGTMEKGKAFKTEQAQKQIKDILLLEAAKNDICDLHKIVKNPKKYLVQSGLVKDADSLLKDGWGQPFELSFQKDDLLVVSKNLQKYQSKQKKEELADSDEDEIEDFE